MIGDPDHLVHGVNTKQSGKCAPMYLSNSSSTHYISNNEIIDYQRRLIMYSMITE